MRPMFIISVLFWLAYGLTAHGYFKKGLCDGEWKDSGIENRYSVIYGCQIEVAPGEWVHVKRFPNSKE